MAQRKYRLVASMTAAVAIGLFLPLPASVSAQDPAAEALKGEQRAAMERFAFMDGEWRGTVVSTGPMGEVALTQTERVGTMASGVVRIIEGRGYQADGTLAFNAVAMITYDTASDEYVMTTTAQGRVGRPWFRPTDTGFHWGFTTGPAKLTYEAVIENGVWTETGYMQIGEEPRTRFLEMRLERTGDSAWPAAGAVGPG